MRIKVFLAVVLALGMMVTISVAPALANDNNDNNNNNQVERRDANLDRALLHELRTDDNNFGCCDNNLGFNDEFNNNCCDFQHDNFGFDSFGFDSFGFLSDCPFAGDFEGSVNQFDCFDD